mmetsp:Transcript_9944/g.13843  ORF Transcript_9944/g.13843 Transcript_9944/m.13843 type:complete len:96 (-) Transcript_9944:129-416(-)
MLRSVLRKVQRLHKCKRNLHASRVKKAEPWKGKAFNDPNQPPFTFEEKFFLYVVFGSSAIATVLLCFKDDLSPYRWAEKVAEEELAAELGPDPTK